MVRGYPVIQCGGRGREGGPDGKDGFLFDADGGVDELTEAIERALECDDSVRQNSMETARSYSEENCARMLLDLYADVIEAKRAKLEKKK